MGVLFISLSKGRVRIDKDSDLPIFLNGGDYIITYIGSVLYLRDRITNSVLYSYDYSEVILPVSVDISDLADILNKRPYFFDLTIIDEDVGDAVDVRVVANLTDFSTLAEQQAQTLILNNIASGQNDGSQKTIITDGTNDANVTGTSLDVNVTGGSISANVNIISNSTDYSTETTLQNLLDELELKADLTETQPVSIQNTPIPITDNGGSLTIDSPQLPATLDGGNFRVMIENPLLAINSTRASAGTDGKVTSFVSAINSGTQTVVSADSTRVALTFYNDLHPARDVFIAMGFNAVASVTGSGAFTYILGNGGFWEVPDKMVTLSATISIVQSSATGALQITRGV